MESLFSPEAAAVVSGGESNADAIVNYRGKGTKKEFRQSTPEELEALFNREILAGRHSLAVAVLCESCREWVDGYWHVTLDRKKLCRKCAAAIGVEGAEERKPDDLMERLPIEVMTDGGIRPEEIGLPLPF